MMKPVKKPEKEDIKSKNKPSSPYFTSGTVSSSPKVIKM